MLDQKYDMKRACDALDLNKGLRVKDNLYPLPALSAERLEHQHEQLVGAVGQSSQHHQLLQCQQHWQPEQQQQCQLREWCGPLILGSCGVSKHMLNTPLCEKEPMTRCASNTDRPKVKDDAAKAAHDETRRMRTGTCKSAAMVISGASGSVIRGFRHVDMLMSQRLEKEPLGQSWVYTFKNFLKCCRSPSESQLQVVA